MWDATPEITRAVTDEHVEKGGVPAEGLYLEKAITQVFAQLLFDEGTRNRLGRLGGQGFYYFMRQALAQQCPRPFRAGGQFLEEEIVGLGDISHYWKPSGVSRIRLI